MLQWKEYMGRYYTFFHFGNVSLPLLGRRGKMLIIFSCLFNLPCFLGIHYFLWRYNYHFEKVNEKYTFSIYLSPLEMLLLKNFFVSLLKKLEIFCIIDKLCIFHMNGIWVNLSPYHFASPRLAIYTFLVNQIFDEWKVKRG